MKNNLSKLSEAELAAMIANAQRVLERRRRSKRKDVIARIRKLAASIGVNVEVTEFGKSGVKKGRPVPVKYRDPAKPANEWTGRGLKPKWLQELLEQGRRIEEFKVDPEV